MPIINLVSTASAFITGIICIGGAIYTLVHWYSNIQKQSIDIAAIKEENTLIVYALSACLEGFSQLGASENILDAKTKLDKYINTRAHK